MSGVLEGRCIQFEFHMGFGKRQFQDCSQVSAFIVRHGIAVPFLFPGIRQRNDPSHRGKI